jgi:hypothetical protein
LPPNGAAQESAGGGPAPVPRHLPAAVRNFTGRAAELTVLRDLLDDLANELADQQRLP